MNSFVSALQFLTRLNLGQAFDQKQVGSSMAWFPSVGLFLGCLLIIIHQTFGQLMPIAVVDLVCIIFLIWITRGLHIDGFCDLMDGFYVGPDKERILQVMDDSQIGSMAAVALWCLLSLKLVVLINLNPAYKIKGLLLMPMVSRWMIVLAAKISPYAKKGEGLGRLFVEQVRWQDFWAATATAVICLSVFLGIQAVQLGILLSTIGFGLIIYIKRQLGGMTGDSLGAIIEITEVVFLLCLLLISN